MYLKPLLYELITYACVFAALDEGDDGEQGRAHKGWGTSADRAMPESSVLPWCPLLQQGNAFFYLSFMKRSLSQVQHFILNVFQETENNTFSWDFL